MNQIQGNPHVAVFQANINATEISAEEFSARYHYWPDSGGYFRLKLGPIGLDISVLAAERLRDRLDWVLNAYRKNPKDTCRHPEDTRAEPKKTTRLTLNEFKELEGSLPGSPEF